MPRQEWVGIEPMGEVFLLTFLFIGLVRYRSISCTTREPIGHSFQLSDQSPKTDDAVDRGIRGRARCGVATKKYVLPYTTQAGQSAPKMPDSISLHMTVAVERACFMITLGSGERMPCNTSSKRSALSNASKQRQPAACSHHP